MGEARFAPDSASTFPASLTTIIWPWPITLPRSNPAKWMWSPSRWSPLGRKPPNASTNCKPQAITPKPTSRTGWPSRPPKRPPNYLHDHIRRELGLAEEQGKRYSWGYPAIPELEDHRKVFELLPAGERTWHESESRLPADPRTIHCRDHCPPSKAKYYSVGESRVEQLMK